MSSGNVEGAFGGDGTEQGDGGVVLTALKTKLEKLVAVEETVRRAKNRFAEKRSTLEMKLETLRTNRKEMIAKLGLLESSVRRLSDARDKLDDELDVRDAEVISLKEKLGIAKKEHQEHGALDRSLSDLKLSK